MFSGQAPDAALFRSLFDAAPDAMIVVDRQGVIVLTNAHAERLFGYEKGALAGLRVEALLPATLRQAHVAHRARYASHPRERAMGAGYELTGIRADGQPFPVEIGLSPVAAPCEALRHQLGTPAQPMCEPRAEGARVAQTLDPIRQGELHRRRGSGGPDIRHQVGEGNVGFVAHGGD